VLFRSKRSLLSIVFTLWLQVIKSTGYPEKEIIHLTPLPPQGGLKPLLNAFIIEPLKSQSMDGFSFMFLCVVLRVPLCLND
jgi:hypothetical protein